MKKEKYVLSVAFSIGLLSFFSCIGHEEIKCTENFTGKIMPSKNQVSQFQNKQTAFFILKNGSICTTTEGLDTQTFYLKGQIEGGRFVVDKNSVIQGSGELEASGKPGWLEISTGEFFPQETGRAPISPYINGYMTDKGFMPSSRVIH